MRPVYYAPLEGIEVVELGGKGPVPFASMLLADLGASVTRVRNPQATHDRRADERLPTGGSVIVADLKNGSDRSAVKSLAANADIVLEGFRPLTAERLGIGPRDIGAAEQRLVFVRCSGWGSHGPTAAKAGHDINYIAAAGLLGEIRSPAGAPVIPLNVVADFGAGGMLCACAAILGLYNVAERGRGLVIEVSMAHGVAYLMSSVFAGLAAGDWSDGAHPSRLDGRSPFYTTYACADGEYLAVGAQEEKFRRAFLNGIGIHEADVTRVVVDSESVSEWPRLYTTIARRIASRPLKEWLSEFENEDACVTPVEDIRKVPESRAAVEGSWFSGGGGGAAFGRVRVPMEIAELEGNERG